MNSSVWAKYKIECSSVQLVDKFMVSKAYDYEWNLSSLWSSL